MMKFLLQEIWILIQANMHYQMTFCFSQKYQFLYPG